MTVPFQIKNVACIGSGVIGAGWIARFIENGINVKIFDPNPNVKTNVDRTLNNADIAFSNLTEL